MNYFNPTGITAGSSYKNGKPIGQEQLNCFSNQAHFFMVSGKQVVKKGLIGLRSL